MKPMLKAYFRGNCKHSELIEKTEINIWKKTYFILITIQDFMVQ